VIQKSNDDVTDDTIAAPIKIWLAHAKERLARQNHDQNHNQEKINHMKIIKNEISIFISSFFEGFCGYIQE